MPIRLEVWGDYALFTRPEMKTERVTYDVMTPSAARGILEAIFWHPGLHWRVDRIHVLNPIRFDNIRRNEVDSIISTSKIRSMAEGRGDGGAIYASESIQQRSSTVLRDVRYVIDAHFELERGKLSPNDSAAKFQSIFMRRAAKGQCFHHPYFGTREFPVDFRLWAGSDEPVGFERRHRDLGYMLYDFDYRDPFHPKPLFFRAALDDGVMDVTSAEVRS
ncbi:type I-C CRISPR-associated protein Cas5c [Bifidobacterium stellenboschense]|uniref:pre-crRNA processing endonuclease n=1 Tax=Bifidobacterium stellenboschense TaxID=762211 RepID=A0A087DU82_9BIFI|nr:type I-C CRISPR-associated protein Cas5c [Bifidobacterium stellenboschense]KFI99082.1 CRISPR-associated protein cas5, subtype I-c/dvulg [Bifidobacterium stellenboschense]